MQHKNTLRKSLVAVGLSAGLVFTLAPNAFGDPTAPAAASVDQSVLDRVSAAQQKVADAQKKADDLEMQLATVSDQHEVAKQKHDADLTHLAELRSQLVQAKADAERARQDLGRVASSMYRGASSPVGTSAQAILTGDPTQVVDQINMIQRVGASNAAIADKAQAEENRVDALEHQAETLEATSAKAETDLAAQVSQLTQLNAEATAAFDQASALLLAANTDLQQAMDRAANAAEQQRLQAIQAQLTSSSGGSSADFIGWSNTGTADWKGYLQSLTDNHITAPSRAQLNNRAAWDPSWQPVVGQGGQQKGIAQVITPKGPILLLPAETINAVNIAFSKVGIPYLWGGTGPRYDCSGLTMTSYRDAGISLPRTSSAQSAAGESIALSDAMPGDLMYFGSPVHHVAIYLGDGMMLNAPHTGALVRVEKVWRGPVERDAPEPGVMNPLAIAAFAVLSAFLGAAFASFLAVVAERVPAGQSINGRSGCPHCGHQIKGYDNIPIISWLLLAGKCRQCRAPIPTWYFGVELVGAVMGLIAFGFGVLASQT